MEGSELKEKCLVLKIWDLKKIGSYFEYSDTVPTGGSMYPTFVQSKSSPICYRIRINKKDYDEDQEKGEGEGLFFAVSKDLTFCALITQDKKLLVYNLLKTTGGNTDFVTQEVFTKSTEKYDKPF